MGSYLNRKNTVGCLKFRQLILCLCLIPFIQLGHASEEELTAEEKKWVSLQMGFLNPYVDLSKKRAPSSFVPNDEVEIRPTELTPWTAKILVEDSAGVMNSVRDDFRRWDKVDEYAQNWNLEDNGSGLYDTPDRAARKAYLNRQLLKYLDKRISGEVKQAEEGSALHHVGQVQQALKPETEAKVSENLKFKLRAKVLQGEATLRVDNPWIDYHTNVNRRGEIKMYAAREIAALGIKTNIDYLMKDGHWVANIDKPLNEKLLARLSSSQSDKDMAFTNSSNRTIQFLFRTPF